MRIGDLKRSDYRTSIYRMRKMEGLQGLYGVHALEIGYTPLLCSAAKYNSLSTVNLNELAQSVNQFLWIILQFLKCGVSNPTIYIYGCCSLLINCTFHGSNQPHCQTTGTRFGDVEEIWRRFPSRRARYRVPSNIYIAL